MLKRIFVIFNAVFLVGLSVVEAKPLPPIGEESRQRLLRELEHDKWMGKSVVRKIEQRENCKVTVEELAAVSAETGEQKPFLVRVYRPVAGRDLPAMIIVPTIRGITVFEPELASKFCASGKIALIADITHDKFPDQYPSWGFENEENRWGILSLRTSLDYLEADPQVDMSKMGVIGLSLGGIVTSMFAATEPQRLQAVVTVVGGGNQPAVLAYSDNGTVEKLRNGRMKAEGIKTLAEYELRLRELIKYDPIYLAPEVRSDRVLMVMGSKDTKVPYANQIELHEAWGRPRALVFDQSHVATIAAITYLHFGRLETFLNDRFGSGPADLRLVNHFLPSRFLDADRDVFDAARFRNAP